MEISRTEQQQFLFPMEELTSSPEERLARTCRSRESAPGCRRGAALAPALRSTLCALPANLGPDTLYGRMWREVAIPKTPQTSSDSSPRLGTVGFLSRTGFWTRSMCEWTGWGVPSRRDEGVCGLSDILEPMSPALLKYFLSPTALRGILRRAESRGKALPTLLAEAIAWMLEWWNAHPELSRQSQEPSNDDTIQVSASTEG